MPLQRMPRAIRALHNQYTLPGGLGPIQVRFADGERDRIGAVEHKLFVGSMNRHATVKEIEEIFAPYGQVEDVYIMRDELKQNRGCGFVKFSHRDMAAAAINALNGTYLMRGCEQPLTVRLADPKRPRVGDLRGSPAFGGRGFDPRPQATSGFRPTSNLGDPMGGRGPPGPWNPMGPQNAGSTSDANAHGFSGQLGTRSGVTSVASSTVRVAPWEALVVLQMVLFQHLHLYPLQSLNRVITNPCHKYHRADIKFCLYRSPFNLPPTCCLRCNYNPRTRRYCLTHRHQHNKATYRFPILPFDPPLIRHFHRNIHLAQ